MQFIFHDQITDISDTRQHALGTLRLVNPTTDKLGQEIWIYIQNDEASTAMAQGEAVMRATGTGTYECLRTSGAVAGLRVVGFAQHSITAQYYGWVLREGVGYVKDGGSGIAADTPFVVAATGEVNAVGAANEEDIVGVTIAAISADATALARVSCKG